MSNYYRDTGKITHQLPPMIFADFIMTNVQKNQPAKNYTFRAFIESLGVCKKFRISERKVNFYKMLE